MTPNHPPRWQRRGSGFGFALALSLVALTPSLTTAEDRTRVDLFDAKSRRQGHAIIDRETGRIDTYDKNSRRTGYGVVRPDGRVDRYRLDGTRAGGAEPVKPTR